MPDFVRKTPEGDTQDRAVCAQCGFVDYQNPRIVTGSVVVHDDHVLLCRRAIEPRHGYWTLPAGYMELNETVAEAAMREAFEEAEARIVIEGVLAIYSISRIGQVQVIHRAQFDGPPKFAPGSETLEAGLFAWDQVPWDDIAFPSVHWALHAWHESRHAPLGTPFGNPSTDPRGTARLIEAVA